MVNKYFGGFSDREDMAAQFEEGTGSKYRWDFVIAPDFPPEEDILFANYDGGGYDGEAFVVGRTNGQLWEVNASHCSCYGLEGQWKPEDTTAAALSIRKPYYCDGEALKFFRELFPKV